MDITKMTSIMQVPKGGTLWRHCHRAGMSSWLFWMPWPGGVERDDRSDPRRWLHPEAGKQGLCATASGYRKFEFAGSTGKASGNDCRGRGAKGQGPRA